MEKTWPTVPLLFKYLTEGTEPVWTWNMVFWLNPLEPGAVLELGVETGKSFPGPVSSRVQFV